MYILYVYILYIITMPSRCHFLHMFPLNSAVKALSKRFSCCAPSVSSAYHVLCFCSPTSSAPSSWSPLSLSYLLPVACGQSTISRCTCVTCGSCFWPCNNRKSNNWKNPSTFVRVLDSGVPCDGLN